MIIQKANDAMGSRQQDDLQLVFGIEGAAGRYFL
jgi:hypothetical protein